MKTKTLITFLGILIICSMFNISCNQNSPAPSTPSAPNTTTATTSTNTPEGLALDMVGHWYLDSVVYYSSPTAHSTTLYGFNVVVTATNSAGAQHIENDLKSTISQTQTPQTLASCGCSNMRESFNITWWRNSSNDTTSYQSNNLSWTVNNNSSSLYANCGNQMNGYVRSYSGNVLVLALNTSTIKSGFWYYWHK